MNIAINNATSKFHLKNKRYHIFDFCDILEDFRSVGNFPTIQHDFSISFYVDNNGWK